MLEIRSWRARARLRTVLIGAPFLMSGVAFTSSGIAQELPEVVATDLFERAMQEQLTVQHVDDRAQAPVTTTLLWIVGLGAAALALRRLRSGHLRWAGRGGVEATHSVLDTLPPAVSDFEEASVVPPGPRKPRKPPEVLKLPQNVLAILERSAAARAAARAALGPESPGDSGRLGGVDVTLPRYDSRRSEE